ncbi:MAG: lipopolysaccharide/colanic/teichoic acid biosynthesis glycosyltransferase [Cyclobacteriaceae bacterium]|jgi:lipopolysaccharide/colanic/teichoic acid biosynthesis glycosyltransferase
MTDKQEIILIGQSSLISGFIKLGLQVSCYMTLGDLQTAFNYRISKKRSLPSFLLIDGDLISLHEMQTFFAFIKEKNVSMTSLIIEEHPDTCIGDLYKSLGIIDNLKSSASAEIIMHRLQAYSSTKTNTTKNQPKQKFISAPKRAFDILCAVMLLTILSPVFILTALAIRLESKGPVFYSQKRVGTGYRIFDFFKFRSMRVNADQLIDQMKNLNHYVPTVETDELSKKHSGTEMLISDDKFIDEGVHVANSNAAVASSFVKINNDPRITKVGHWIRKTSIDELPQLVNVLIGDMSLVGNRPLPLYEAETLTNDDWSERFLAPAGITGLWQVTERGKKVTSADSRKALDIEYARNNSFWMDLKILAKTPLAALQQEKV